MNIQNPFSIDHLPYGVVNFGNDTPHLCVRFQDLAISLEVLRRQGDLTPDCLTQSVTLCRNIGPFLKLSTADHAQVRSLLQKAISDGDHSRIEGSFLELAPYPDDDGRVLCPVQPRDFVDFYSSRHHAFRVGCLFRGPENALPEQYFHLPIGYHGRSSTIVPSGREIARPSGIVRGEPPKFQPSDRLDYELEVGFVLKGQQGRLSPEKAWEKIFGVVLVNDWSARDIQAFEYRPLGPFLGKSFATSVGCWVTPLEALRNYIAPNLDSDHSVLPHLSESQPHHIDLPLSATLTSASGESEVICRTNLKNLAWSAAQMVAHISSNGTIISAGDLIATGTVSGPENDARACLLELTEGGKTSLALGAEQRTFLLDGDTLTIQGGHEGLGLAPCRGRIVQEAS